MSIQWLVLRLGSSNGLGVATLSSPGAICLGVTLYCSLCLLSKSAAVSTLLAPSPSASWGAHWGPTPQYLPVVLRPWSNPAQGGCSRQPQPPLGAEMRPDPLTQGTVAHQCHWAPPPIRTSTASLGTRVARPPTSPPPFPSLTLV